MAENDTNGGWLKRNRGILLLAGPIVILAAAAYFYLTGGRFISTDDAYIAAARTQISTDIPGRIIAIDVHDNQPVHKGDILFKLDERDYAIAVRDAQARLANARLQIAALEATDRQHQADVRAARATLAYATREYDRQKNLASQGISSQAQLDQARHTFEAAEQQVLSSQHERENVEASLGEVAQATAADPPGDARAGGARAANSPADNRAPGTHPGDDPAAEDHSIDDHPTVRAAQAVLDKAELDLSHTIIHAPSDGIVSKVEQLQVGDYINAAVPVFALVSATDVWVEANYKETQLTYMRAGQTAEISVDTYPDRTFHGRVTSFSPGTGSSFSLLPAENSTGNWVKVVQRLPVRISIDDPDPNFPVQPGLSVTVDVDTHHSRLGSH